MISTDNGFGFSPYTRSSPSRPIHYAFSRGVETFHFIPDGQPQKNGVVERFHRSLKSDWIHTYPEDDSELSVITWMNQALSRYNTVFRHRAIKSTPAAKHGSYTHLDVAYHDSAFRYTEKSHVGTIAYTRKADSMGLVSINSPAMLVDMNTQGVFGRYIRLEFPMDSNTGTAYVIDDDNTLVYAGSFQHEFGPYKVETQNGYLPVQLEPSFSCSPRPFDESLELQRKVKHWKERKEEVKRRVLRLDLPPGFQVVARGDDLYVLDRTGQVVTTSQQYVLDHRSEVLGDGWDVLSETKLS